MRNIILLLMLLMFFSTSLCQADSWEVNLNAGNTSILSGINYKRDLLQGGYFKSGVSVLYSDDDDMEYKWAELNLMVGRENIHPGLTCEVGFKGILGDAEEGEFSGDVGAVAFTGYIGYLFPRHIMPLPLEVFSSLDYAPEILSFGDAENFLSFRIGTGIRVIQNASLILEYSAHDVDMAAGPESWNFNDNIIRLGLLLRF